MIIRFNNGQASAAILLSKTESVMRVALRGSDDTMELRQIHGVWVSEDHCEPVRVEFARTRQQGTDQVTEADCICSHELAARLIHLLYSGEDDAPATPALARRSGLPTATQHVI